MLLIQLKNNVSTALIFDTLYSHFANKSLSTKKVHSVSKTFSAYQATKSDIPKKDTE